MIAYVTGGGLWWWKNKILAILINSQQLLEYFTLWFASIWQMNSNITVSVKPCLLYLMHITHKSVILTLTLSFSVSLTQKHLPLKPTWLSCRGQRLHIKMSRQHSPDNLTLHPFMTSLRGGCLFVCAHVCASLWWEVRTMCVMTEGQIYRVSVTPSLKQAPPPRKKY